MFTDMRDGTEADWAVISARHREHQAGAMVDQVILALRQMSHMKLGFAADQMTHSLMTATLARGDCATDEEVVAALCHDIGKTLSIPNHGPIAAEMLKPYVGVDIYHAIYWHQDFQGRYYYAFRSKNPAARNAFRNESWFAFAEKLVDRWDAPAFDPDFPVDPIDSFEPELRRVFAAPRTVEHWPR